MSAPYKGKSFVGTFGGCKAGTLLDELLVKRNDPKLIAKISVFVSYWTHQFRDCCRHIQKKSLRDKVLLMFKAEAYNRITTMDLTKFKLTAEEEVFVRGYSNNIITIEYRRAMNSELGL